MLQLEVLVCEASRTVYACITSTISVDEVASLDHEVLDHSVDSTAFVSLRFAKMVPGLACAVYSKVLGGARYDVCEELYLDAAQRLAAECHVEEHDWVRFGCHGLYASSVQTTIEMQC